MTSQGNTLVPTGSDFHVEDGSDAFTVLLEAWPDANPVSLEQIPNLDDQQTIDFIAERQTSFGINPRLDPRHPNHFEWVDETLVGLQAQESAAKADFETQLP